MMYVFQPTPSFKTLTSYSSSINILFFQAEKMTEQLVRDGEWGGKEVQEIGIVSIDRWTG